MTHNCPHCGCETGVEVLRRDVPVGRDPSWLVRYRDQHFVISTGRDGATQAFRASPDGEVTDWDDVAGGYGKTRGQVLDDLTGRPVDETGHVMSPRDVLDDADRDEEQVPGGPGPYTHIVKRASGYVAGYFRGEPPACFVPECNANVPGDPAHVEVLDDEWPDSFTDEARTTPGTPVDPELFRRTAPQWNCVDFPGEGMHYTPHGDCAWCGKTREQITEETRS